MKFRDGYWCYCTGRQSDGRCFRIFHSDDLVQWRDKGTAMEPLSGNDTEYWAPEVSYLEGRFYLYYSVGDGLNMQIRVAVADSPGGPFTDSGHRLTDQEFAIDPHVFVDEDGRRWMFYATDFLDHTHVGTGTVRDRFVDAFKLAGRPLPVTRGRFDWHVFDPNRVEKGGVRWHTVEGPAVVKYKGLYYQMFSGGNWKNDSYGVGYAFSDDIEREGEWTQVSDGKSVLPLLRTVPGQAIGPGHNSVTQGPDTRQLYCVYHRWDENGEARLMAIDRMQFIGSELVVFGPSASPQWYPSLPQIRCLAGGDTFGADWELTGNWVYDENIATQEESHGWAEARPSITVNAGASLEVWLRGGTESTAGTYGVSVSDDASALLQIRINPGRARLEFSGVPDFSFVCRHLDLPDSFRTTSYHRLHVQTSGRVVSASLDEVPIGNTLLSRTATRVGLFTEGTSAQFSGFSLTRGWQDTFTDQAVGLAELGWHGDIADWRVEAMQLWKKNDASTSAIFKAVPSESYEYVVNAKLMANAGPGSYGFYPAASEKEPGLLLSVLRTDDKWHLWLCGGPIKEGLEVRAALPDAFRVEEYEQFRFRVRGNSLTVAWRAQVVYEGAIVSQRARVGIYANGAAVVDMVRVTDLT